MKILQVSYRVPFPPNDGGTIGIYNITKGLSDEGMEMYTFSINTPKHSQPKDALKGISIQQDVYVDTGISPYKLILNYLFSEKPYNVMRFANRKVEKKLIELLKGRKFDVIHVEGTFMAHYFSILRKYSKAPIVIRAHNLENTIWERLAENERNLVKRIYFRSLAKRIKQFESVYYTNFDAVAAITEEDKKRLLNLGVKTRIEVIPAGVIVEKFAKNAIEPKSRNSVFILSALDWIPNQEALIWFIDNVWEHVEKKNPECVLHIAGKNTPDFIYNYEKSSIKVHGFVEDAAEFMETFNLMLVPLLSGGGMRIKIIEGMAAGKCILASDVGAEGIEFTNCKNIIICNDAMEWAKNINYYLENEKESLQIGANAKILVDELYDNRTISQKYIKLYQSLIKE